jgi:hydrogenase maturation protein HypF
MSEISGVRIHINGVVQGVGFRPFVYGLADRLSLKGWVRNTSAGVDVELDGPPEALRSFIESLNHEAPPLARIDDVSVEDREPDGFTTFEIVHSEAVPGAFQPISPDMSVCSDCLRELFDEQDRRYRYPFINCTNCGPRFTIIQDVPYDRPYTTMAPFEMCPDCAAEYEDPLDRRFHAQPVACPACGPQIWLESRGEKLAEREEALQATRRLLAEGTIVAVKGLGGFHLACDATAAESVRTLRDRKLRVDKPFALMMPDLEAVQLHCEISDTERQLLLSQERPIVILKRRADSSVAREVAPNQDTIAVMLPYTPLHALLMERDDGFPEALVMTSGNLSEEPIAISNEEARDRLADLADAFLMHDREIQTRCDDPVLRAFEDEIYPLRRSRGYAPFPVHLPVELPAVLATGAELKNAFCVTRGSYAFLSHHIGDMENYETLRSFEQGIDHFERLFRVQPEAIAYDLHPDYMATRYALERAAREELPAIGVQHHHAHVAACMVEHGFTGDAPVIGVAFDGTGYGDDEAIWGGEFLLANYAGYERPYHLRYFKLPGGDAAVRKPWRIALSLLEQSGIDWDDDWAPVQAASEEALGVVRRQLDADLNAPLTSSMGRLFDAAAALVGIRQEVNYEAQAAIELEAIVDIQHEQAYEFGIEGGTVDHAPVVEAVVADLRNGLAPEQIAARFHNAVAGMIASVCDRIRADSGVADVLLTGGVMQNMVLLTKTVHLLRHAGFEVYIHRQVPANDGGLALGQAVIAGSKLGPRRSGA